MALNLKDAVAPFAGRLPKERYTLLCKKTEYGLSKSSSKPMITFTWEVHAPAEVMIDGVKTNVAGAEMKSYLVLTQEQAGRVKEFYDKIEKPIDELDETNPDLSVFANLVVDAECSSERSQSFKELTPEEKAAGKAHGEPLKTADGKDIVRWYPKINNILGLGQLNENRPYA